MENQQRPDKEWSLTDCLWFVVMQQYNVTRAWPTTDNLRRRVGKHYYDVIRTVDFLSDRVLVWAAMPNDTDPKKCPLRLFLPYLSKRVQRVIDKLQVESAYDLLLVDVETQHQHGSGEASIIETDQLNLRPKGLSLRRAIQIVRQ